MMARELGKDTQLASLELSLESGDVGAGTCDGGYSCTYAHTIAWRSPTTPLPMEHNPRVVFERLFGDGGSTDPRARLARMKRNRSILDSVTDKVAEPAARRSVRRDGTKISRVSRCHSGHRAAHPASRGAEHPRAAGLRRAGRRAGDVRRTCPADVRPAGARLPERHDARHHVHGGPRVQQPDLSGDRRARRAPPAVAREQRVEPGAADAHQHASRAAVRVLPREAAADAGWRRLAAGSPHAATTAPACATATTCRRTCRWCWSAIIGVKGGRHIKYPTAPRRSPISTRPCCIGSGCESSSCTTHRAAGPLDRRESA